MASSNRHWPSMFKSKPCNTQHHQWQHDLNPSLLSSSGCNRTSPYSSGCEERTPEPKPRWNPKPEQIRILEAIFDSGMVNPPRDEIRKIRGQLQEYGQVGDANVFYWFQNRKSRSKHKLRHLQTSKQQRQQQNQNTNTNTSNNHHLNPITSSMSPAITAPNSSSSSSSSDRTSPTGSKKTNLSLGSCSTDALDVPNPVMSMNQAYFSQNHHGDFFTEPSLLFPQQSHQGVSTCVFSQAGQGLCFSPLASVVQVPHEQSPNIGPCTSLLLSEIMNNNNNNNAAGSEKLGQSDHHKVKMMQLPTTSLGNNCSVINPLGTTHSAVSTTVTTSLPLPSTNINHLQGVPEASNEAKSTVFINDVAFQVASGPFNVQDAFGDDAVLINASGELVLTNEWGLTLQSLQHGASYYLI
ncbi:WUSCHEL-related homeobox 9 isoform X2 [Syzygium oleosum]|uniref:WUSCHEL-related homeobox 9 isoform X2 n=1 Tax=Syzygium oleosum TaxID=219896 RepID=UPI0024BBB3C4|nr:WUSCHEL-related homeobox 9 isoform X2 [Syzygium oleosum]